MKSASFLEAYSEKLAASGMGWLVSAIRILAAFILAGIAVKLISAAANRMLRRYKSWGHHSEAHIKRLETGSSMIVGISKYILYFVAIAITVGELGFSSAMTSLLAAAGIGTLAVGVGAQNVIADIAAGFFILFEDQIAVGDYVEAAGVEGTVEDITLRTTVIKGWRGEKHIIPNSQIKTVVNYTRADYLSVVKVSIAREADTERAMAILLEEMQKMHMEMGLSEDALPDKCEVVDTGDSGATLQVCTSAGATQQWRIQREVTRRVLKRFREEGIDAPAERVILRERA